MPQNTTCIPKDTFGEELSEEWNDEQLWFFVIVCFFKIEIS